MSNLLQLLSMMAFPVAILSGIRWLNRRADHGAHPRSVGHGAGDR